VVTDRYGRELGKKYETSHESGVTPIVEKFIISPAVP
jgi:hypothetical protein